METPKPKKTRAMRKVGKPWYRKRKFMLTLTGLAAIAAKVVLTQSVGPEDVGGAVALIAGFNAAEGYADGKGAAAKDIVLAGNINKQGNRELVKAVPVFLEHLERMKAAEFEQEDKRAERRRQYIADHPEALEGPPFFDPPTPIRPDPDDEPIPEVTAPPEPTPEGGGGTG